MRSKTSKANFHALKTFCLKRFGEEYEENLSLKGSPHIYRPIILSETNLSDFQKLGYAIGHRRTSALGIASGGAE